MGNKLFKVHVKHSSRNVEVALTPDTSVLQLKEKISAEFDVAPEQQILHCNGKLMEAEDNETIKQAKIPNGSKILCTLSQKQRDPVADDLAKIESSADDLETSLTKLVKQRKSLLKDQQPSSLFFDVQSEDFRKFKLESKKVGEQLMQLLESLDSLDCSDQAQRTKRKQLATKINSILDKNDKLGNKLNHDTK